MAAVVKTGEMLTGRLGRRHFAAAKRENCHGWSRLTSKQSRPPRSSVVSGFLKNNNRAICTHEKFVFETTARETGGEAEHWSAEI
jgi:hypothetical protein